MEPNFQTKEEVSTTWSIWIRNPYPFREHSEQGHNELTPIIKTIEEAFDIIITYHAHNDCYHEVRVTSSTLGARVYCLSIRDIAGALSLMHRYAFHTHDPNLIITLNGAFYWTATTEHRKPEWVLVLDQLLAARSENNHE